MTETLFQLLCALVFFVVGHFLMASLPVRQGIAGRFGVNAYRGLFSIVSAVGLVWTIWAYGAARPATTYLWDPMPVYSMVPVAVMPIVCILLVCAWSTRSPTSVGGEKLVGDPVPAVGIVTVTRHPMMVAVVLWAVAHMVPNGDTATLMLCTGMLILAVGGILHIDYRRRVTLGSDWGPVALTTSVIPFVAAVQGRGRIDWRGIGIWRVVAGIVLYVALMHGHVWFTGVPVL